MDFIDQDCTGCGATNQILQSKRTERFVWRCNACDLWHVSRKRIEEHEDGVFDIEGLGDPPACPAVGCDAELTGAAFPEHLLENHASEFSG